MTAGTREPLRVVVADDHPFYRSGLARALTANGIAVVAEAANGGAAVQAVRESGPDVVVMDLNMPGVSGLDATRRLIEEAPETRVLVLTVSADEADVTDAILAGACGYVLKDRPVQEVVEAIRAAARGDSPFTAQLAIPLLRQLRHATGIEVDLTGVPLDGLERQVLALVGEGRTEHQIADALGISSGAVRDHASAVVAKLQSMKRVQAALRAADTGD